MSYKLKDTDEVSPEKKQVEKTFMTPLTQVLTLGDLNARLANINQRIARSENELEKLKEKRTEIENDIKEVEKLVNV